MQYCSIQHWTLLSPPETSTTECCFCFGPATSFFLELFFHSFPVTYWTPTVLGSSSSGVIFCLFILGFSRQGQWSGLPFSSTLDHILSELSTMTCLSCVALHGMACSFIELQKAVIHVITWLPPSGNIWELLVSLGTWDCIQASFDLPEHTAVGRVLLVDAVQKVHFDNVLRNCILETIKHLAPVAQCHVLVQRHMFDVIQTSTCPEAWQWVRLQAVHVEQARSTVTLDERGQATTLVTSEEVKPTLTGKGTRPLWSNSCYVFLTFFLVVSFFLLLLLEPGSTVVQVTSFINFVDLFQETFFCFIVFLSFLVFNFIVFCSDKYYFNFLHILKFIASIF